MQSMIISALVGAASAMVNHDGTIRVHATNLCVSKNNEFHITPVFEAGNLLKIRTCEGSSEAITQQWSYSEETLQISGGPDNAFCWSVQGREDDGIPQGAQTFITWVQYMSPLPKRVILANCDSDDERQKFVYSAGLIKPRMREDICLGFPPNTDASFLNSFRCFSTSWGEITHENRDLGEHGLFSEYSHNMLVEGEAKPGMAEPIKQLKSMSGNMCVFSRWPGYQAESIQFVWQCDNSGLETTNNQWRKFDFSFENGMIKSQGSVYKDAENPMCIAIRDSAAITSQKLVISACNETDPDQQWNFDSWGTKTLSSISSGNTLCFAWDWDTNGSSLLAVPCYSNLFNGNGDDNAYPALDENSCKWWFQSSDFMSMHDSPIPCQVCDQENPFLCSVCEGDAVPGGNGTFCECPRGYHTSEALGECIKHTKKECLSLYSGVNECSGCQQLDDDDYVDSKLCTDCVDQNAVINGTGQGCVCGGDFEEVFGRCLGTFKPCEVTAPCQNEGVCADFITESQTYSYTCACPENYTGENCQHFLPCSNTPCQNNASCENVYSENTDTYQPVCTCSEEYSGNFCENFLPCSDDPCRNDAVCENVGDFQNVKKTSRKGKTFSRNVFMGFKAECVCEAGFSGEFCEHALACFENPCQNNGVCSEVESENGFSAVCACVDTFTGNFCEHELPCSVEGFSCLNQGVCSNEAVEETRMRSHKNNGKVETKTWRVVSGYNAVCTCGEGFTGGICEHYLPCVNQNQCQNDALCEDVEQFSDEGTLVGYESECNCTSDYTGEFCQHFLPCSANPCDDEGSASCVNQEIVQQRRSRKSGVWVYKTTVTGFNAVCECFPGFTGDDCATKIPCHSSPCLNDATCEDITNFSDYLCGCQINANTGNDIFTGKNCETFMPCHGNPCAEGSCSNAANSTQDYVCECREGWTGDDCDIKMPCSENPCQNGTCFNTADYSGYTCDCVDTFSGPNCEHFLLCSETPCDNNATCVDQVGDDTFHCQCQTGYMGETCGIQIPCNFFEQDCLNGAGCVNMEVVDDDGFLVDFDMECVCKPGFTGEFCEHALACHVNPCQNGGTCTEVETDDGFEASCSCQDTHSGKFCQHELPCNNGFECLNGGACANEEISEARTNKRQTKTWRVISGYNAVCTCEEGFVGDTCESELPCITQTPCMNNATCENLATASDGFVCHCTDEYVGKKCDLFLPCSETPCQNDAICQDKMMLECVGDDCLVQGWLDWNIDFFGIPLTSPQLIERIDGYSCECSEEYTGDNCEQLLLCSENPCENNSTCIDHIENKDFECQCQNGYMGRNCEIQVPCTFFEQDCLNGAGCVNMEVVNDEGFLVDFDMECTCKPGFTGEFCEHALACHVNPCQNQGGCTEVETDDGFEASCACQDTHSGKFCQHELPCNNGFECLNGGACANEEISETRSNKRQTKTWRTITGYNAVCTCEEGYVGDICEHELTCITQTPCMNNATCENSVQENGFYDTVCGCTDEYVGRTCELFLPCSETPCQNGAFCHDKTSMNPEDFTVVSVDGYLCECNEDYSGPHCEHFLLCSETPCQNNATCTDQVGDDTFQCQCQTGYVGKTCEIQVPCMFFEQDCQNGAGCVNMEVMNDEGVLEDFDMICTCKPGFTGEFCEHEVPCSKNPCQNEGTCTNSEDMISSYTCNCTEAYTGTDCEHFLPCSEISCINDHWTLNGEEAVCHDNPVYTLVDGVDVVDRYEHECVCSVNENTNLVEFVGGKCETWQACSTAPCLNNGTCAEDIPNYDYICTCPEGFTGRNCQFEIPCSLEPCQNGATCANSDDGISDYTCACLQGWTSKDCDEPTFCASNFNMDLQNKFGLYLDNLELDTIISREFQSEDDETTANYTVRVSGETVDQIHYTENFDLAFNIELGEQQDTRYTQILKIGENGFSNPKLSFNQAKYGFDTIVVSFNSNPDSDNGEQRIFVQTGWSAGETHSVFIRVLEGFMFVYSDSELLYKQLWNGAVLEATCNLVSTTGRVAYDQSVYVGSGVSNIEYSNLALDHGFPCANIESATCGAGQCRENADFTDFYCACEEGHTGMFCETEVPCLNNNPCGDFGGCVNSDDFLSSTCECDSDYTGVFCDVHIACSIDPCMNGGNCTNSADYQSYTCECSTSFTGAECELELPCAANNCLNFAECVNSGDFLSFTCDCKSGYSGADCGKIDPTLEQFNQVFMSLGASLPNLEYDTVKASLCECFLEKNNQTCMNGVPINTAPGVEVCQVDMSGVASETKFSVKFNNYGSPSRDNYLVQVGSAFENSPAITFPTNYFTKANLVFMTPGTGENRWWGAGIHVVEVSTGWTSLNQVYDVSIIQAFGYVVMYSNGEFIHAEKLTNPHTFEEGDLQPVYFGGNQGKLRSDATFNSFEYTSYTEKVMAMCGEQPYDPSLHECCAAGYVNMIGLC